MPAPPVYLDECIDRPCAEGLRRRGFDLLTTRDAGVLSSGDERQLAHATRLGRVLLSYNRVHFLRWHRVFEEQGRPHGGIVILPQSPPLSRRVLRAAMLLDWIADQDFHSRVFTWGTLQQELIRGHRLTGERYTEADVRHALGWE
jgi:hypothetical protein